MPAPDHDGVRPVSPGGTARADELALLARIVAGAGAHAPPEELLQDAAAGLARILPRTRVTIVRLTGEHAPEVVARGPEGHGGDARALALATATVGSGPGGAGAPDASRDEDDALCVPIVARDERWGAIVADPGPDAGGDPRPAGLVAVVGNAIGIAVTRGDATEHIVASTAAQIFGAELDVRSTLEAVVDAAKRALRADRATCYVHSGGSDMPISAVVSTESDPARARALDATVGMTRNRLPLLARLLEEPDALFMVPDVATSEAVPEDVARIIRTGAFLGLRLDRRASAEGDQGEFLGSLFVSFDRPRWLSPAELHTARALGTLATMAISNARLHEEALGRLARAERLATVDSLTQLANHRALQDALRHEFERARRHRRPLALALLDLDHFKRVNDTVGHEGGDAVLRDVAERLRGVARDGDLVARVGGEEFAWLMPDTDAIGAWEAAERAREAVAAGPVAGIDLLTLSAGVCDVAHAATPDDLYRLADGALYWAKARGRDATYRYSPDVVTALSADERAEQLERSQAVMSIRLLARVVDAKDPSTRRHSERVAELTIRLATALGWDQRRLVELHEAALVHDVGKIGVPDAVLFKPGRLTAEEYEVVKQHAALSAEMVADVLTDTQVAWVRSHHERWDGTGYPDGLEAREIPPGARIIALADAWDVMTGERPYSGPIPPGEALAEARRMRGRQFAPEVVDAMERLVASGVVGSAPRPAERASA